MKVRNHYWLSQLVAIVSLLATGAASAACPGDSTYANVKSIVINGFGDGANIYIEVDTSTGSGTDVCTCKDPSTGMLFLLRPENPIGSATKLQIAIAMEAKALNKRIKYYGTGCFYGASSGYASFTQITLEP